MRTQVINLKKIAERNNRDRAEGLRILLDAASYLRYTHSGLNERRAIKLLLEMSVKLVGNAIYMNYGLRIDRNEDGHLTLVNESDYYATAAGKLVRL